MMFYNNDNDITDGIDTNIRAAIDKSMNNSSIETFQVLLTFVREVIRLSIANRSIKHFKAYLFFLSYSYFASYSKAKRGIVSAELQRFCSDQAVLHLKEILLYDIYFERLKNTNDNEQIIELNQFYYWGFTTFSQLLYYIVNNGDTQQFRFSMDQFDQIVDNDYHKHHDLKWKINLLEIENKEGENNEDIEHIKETLKIVKAFDDYRRHTIQGVKYWIMFLYSRDKIDKTVVSDFVERLIVQADANDLLEDILFFRRRPHYNYMGWENWDYMERPSGKAYNPPNPSQWLTYGFLVDQVRSKSLYINIQDLDSDELSQIDFLYKDLENNCSYLQKNFERWRNILKVESEEELKEKCDNILRVFGEVKKKRSNDVDYEIANVDLSPDLIGKFRETTGNAWKNQARIHKLFKEKGTTQNVSRSGIKLKDIGQRIFLEKAKMMFIEGKHHQTIYGAESIGGEIGRWEDDFFFSSIMTEDYNKVTGNDIVDTIEQSIAEIKGKGIVPDLILLSPEYTYRERSFLDNEKFISKMNEPQSENDMWSFYMGTFDQIPIYSSYSNFLKNKVVVCNFSDSFKMKYKTDKDWFEQELKVDVRMITDKEAKKYLEEEPAKWKNTTEGIPLSDEEALTLIKTSVIMYIWTTVDFQVLNKDAYVVGFIVGGKSSYE